MNEGKIDSSNLNDAPFPAKKEDNPFPNVWTCSFLSYGTLNYFPVV